MNMQVIVPITDIVHSCNCLLEGQVLGPVAYWCWFLQLAHWAARIVATYCVDVCRGDHCKRLINIHGATLLSGDKESALCVFSRRFFLDGSDDNFLTRALRSVVVRVDQLATKCCL